MRTLITDIVAPMFFLSRTREDDAVVCFSAEHKFRRRGGCHEVTGGLRSDVTIALARMVEAALETWLKPQIQGPSGTWSWDEWG